MEKAGTRDEGRRFAHCEGMRAGRQASARAVIIIGRREGDVLSTMDCKFLTERGRPTSQVVPARVAMNARCCKCRLGALHPVALEFNAPLQSNAQLVNCPGLCSVVGQKEHLLARKERERHEMFFFTSGRST